MDVHFLFRLCLNGQRYSFKIIALNDSGFKSNINNLFQSKRATSAYQVVIYARHNDRGDQLSFVASQQSTATEVFKNISSIFWVSGYISHMYTQINLTHNVISVFVTEHDVGEYLMEIPRRKSPLLETGYKPITSQPVPSWSAVYPSLEMFQPPSELTSRALTTSFWGPWPCSRHQ